MSKQDESARAAADQAKRWSATALSFLLGLVAAPLPERWRRAIPLLDGSAHAEASVPSALIQLVGGLFLFFFGYAAWMDAQYAAIDAAAEAAGHAGRWNVDENKALGAALMTGNPFLIPIYALTSLTGLTTGVASVGGLVRLLHGAITRDVMPDPLLGLIDLGLRKLRGETARRVRERSKDRSPDKLIMGSAKDDFAIIIETSKDLDWREGNTIIVASTWYRLRSKSESKGPSGLRLRYILEEMPVGVAVRGVRRYDPGHAPEIVSST